MKEDHAWQENTTLPYKDRPLNFRFRLKVGRPVKTIAATGVVELSTP